MMMTIENRKKAEGIIFGDTVSWTSSKDDVMPFEDLTYIDLRQLVRAGLIDKQKHIGGNRILKGENEEIPTIEQTKRFMSIYDDFTAYGMLVHKYSNSGEFVLEGLHYTGEVDKDLFVDFLKLFGDADYLAIKPGELRCWYE